MDFDKSSIEKLKKTLYSRNEELVPKEKRTPVQPRENDAPTSWGTNPSYELQPEIMAKKSNSFFNKFLIGSLAFFLVSLGIALFVFFGGINMISSDNLDIKIVAPSSIASGEELAIGLSIINANRSDIQDVDLFITYPEGSQVVGSEKNLAREKIDLGTIAKGELKDYSVRTLLFGEKDSVKTFTFKLEYRVKGSNAVFSKERNYEVLIGSSPILLNVSYPKEVNSGQLVTLVADVTSNSSVPLKNVIVKVEYPYGFTYKEASIKPIRDNSVWNVGDLKDGDKKTITIRGTLLGQNLEDRSFNFSVGTESPTNLKDFDATLATDLVTIGIRKSFFDLAVVSDRNGIASVGENVPVSIRWTNTLPDKVLDNKIEVKISGNIFDRNRVSVGQNGFYNSSSNSITWDKNSTNLLDSLFPGDSGEVSFSISSLSNLAQVRSIKNPFINLHVTMTGERSGGEIENISSEEDLMIKISSQVTLEAKSYRNIGPLKNTGTIPPKADRETTYTITWTLTNTTNNLKEAVVFATLPQGVTWKAETAPVGETVSFNPDNRIVSWEVGSVSAGAGFASSPKTVSFKVGITPNVTQIGSTPFLTSDISSESVDAWTEKMIKITAPAVSIKFSDPSFVSGNETVVK